MLRFSRKIRQDLLTKRKIALTESEDTVQTLSISNNMRKYIFYAVGEIILVMIGILLALQVNNWNENRKNKELINTYKRKRPTKYIL